MTLANNAARISVFVNICENGAICGLFPCGHFYGQSVAIKLSTACKITTYRQNSPDIHADIRADTSLDLISVRFQPGQCSALAGFIHSATVTVEPPGWSNFRSSFKLAFLHRP